MGEVSGEVEIAAPLAEVWELYTDPSRWPAWVDGFGSVISREGYPDPGGSVRWRSTPAGRGEVAETVLAAEPRRELRIGYRDPGSAGEVETSFEMLPAAEAGGDRRTKVSVRHAYEISSGGPLKPVIDRLFVRSQMQRALDRSLAALKLAAEESAAGT